MSGCEVEQRIAEFEVVGCGVESAKWFSLNPDGGFKKLAHKG